MEESWKAVVKGGFTQAEMGGMGWPKGSPEDEEENKEKEGEISSCPVCQGQGRVFRGWMWGMDSILFGT